VRTLVRQRLMLGSMMGVRGEKTLIEILREAEIHLHGVRLNAPDLSAESHSVAVTVRGPGGTAMFHGMFNAYWEPLTFELPSPGTGVDATWRRWIDTYRDAPDDVCAAPPAAPRGEGVSYTVQPRSVVMLFAMREL
jgi:isoamylase